MATRNGASTYRCLGCRGELGTIRRTALLLRMFTPAAGVVARYVEGGTFEVVCRCGKVTPVDWRGDRT